MTPAWLHLLAAAALGLGIMLAVVIAVDEISHPQPMAIMNVVWPVAALFGTLFTAVAYFTYEHPLGPRGNRRRPPFFVSVGKAATHCGAGCTIGDIIAEWLTFMWPAIATAFGWKTLFPDKTFATWIFDFILAFAFGIVFQYYAIAPMRKDFSARQALVAALKADALSLAAWQIGMYAFMAFAKFYLFARVLAVELRVDTPEFWFMMQIAMLCGFLTSYPVNWWLVTAGIKETM